MLNTTGEGSAFPDMVTVATAGSVEAGWLVGSASFGYSVDLLSLNEEYGHTEKAQRCFKDSEEVQLVIVYEGACSFYEF
jgi:hypothetical protein